MLKRKPYKFSNLSPRTANSATEKRTKTHNRFCCCTISVFPSINFTRVQGNAQISKIVLGIWILLNTLNQVRIRGSCVRDQQKTKASQDAKSDDHFPPTYHNTMYILPKCRLQKSSVKKLAKVNPTPLPLKTKKKKFPVPSLPPNLRQWSRRQFECTHGGLNTFFTLHGVFFL